MEGDDTIIVSKPGTEFLVAYQMRPSEPFLIMTHTWLAPTIMSREITDFRAKAFAAAVTKARELGGSCSGVLTPSAEGRSAKKANRL
jgi:hypothetical protein